jgi:hypothetical protein
MFSNTTSFLSSRNDSDQVLHPYKTTGKIIRQLNDRHMLIHAHTENILPSPPVPTVRMQNVIVSSVQITAHYSETSSNSPLEKEINAAIKIVPNSDYCSLNIHFTTTGSQLVIL